VSIYGGGGGQKRFCQEKIDALVLDYFF